MTFNQENLKSELIVFAGMIRGGGLIYNWCRQNNRDFLYIDHAYISRGYNSSNPDKEWMRVTKSNFVWNKNVPESGERWKQHFAHRYHLKPWRSNGGKNILVLPPSNASKYLFPDCTTWMNSTMEKVRKALPDAPIVIREKPEQPVIHPITNQVVNRQKHEHQRSIEEEMENARLIVTYNSAVPVTGIMHGIPCISSYNGAAFPMNTPIAELDNPQEPDRQAWLNQLVHHQFSSAEMKNGMMWEMLKKYDQGLY